MRRNDINGAGEDECAHKNDEELSGVTFTLPHQKMKEVFKSIGVLDKEGEFPIGKLLEMRDNIDNSNMLQIEKIRKKMDLIQDYCPECAKCQKSTMALLSTMFENQPDLEEVQIDRVYDKDDKNKVPNIYVCTVFENGEKTFSLINSNSGEIEEYTLAVFEEKFDCYQKDMEERGGKMWHSLGEQKQEELAHGTGQINETEEER